ncbi:MAG TPA: DUF2946 family protein [Reyranella sp.]|nr:DUF2946 family protein [Reyranella sp.]
MDGDRQRNGTGKVSGARAAALLAALFAITFNFLQPLAHAALMRDATPSTLWTVLCTTPTADQGNDSGSAPTIAQDHKCCLGLAFAPALLAPPEQFIVLPPVALASRPLVAVEPTAAVGIRDGPSSPRGPPSFA